MLNRLLLAAGLWSAALAAPAAPEYDLVVYGGTASGVMTAVSAARQGASVALIEPTGHLGGMVSGGLSATDFGRKEVVGGIAREFYRRLGKVYNEPITWYPEPHVAERVLNEMLKETSVTVILNSRLREKTGVEKDGARVRSITMEDGRTFTAKVFADCGYEGDLMAQAGVTYTWGREGQDEFGESLAGVRERTPKHQFKVDVKARGADGKLLPEIQGTGKGVPGSADRKVQAYNFRLCMTTNRDNMVPFPKPPGYDPSRYELLARMIEAHVEKEGHAPRVRDLMHPFRIKGGKTDTNNNGAFSTDYIGGSWDYPEADYATREKIWQEHYNYIAGFLWFLSHDERVPQELRDEMNRWGLAKDEFTDTNHWPRQLYVREARRMRGEYVMSQADIQTSRTKEDSIGMGSYNSDSHNVQRIENEQGFAENEGDMQVRVEPYEIPYRILLPKRAEAENLLVPVTLSATHVAYSTLRMEPVYMIMGQAAGVAARMAAEKGVPVHDIDVQAMQAVLRASGGVLTYDERIAEEEAAPAPRAKNRLTTAAR